MPNRITASREQLRRFAAKSSVSDCRNFGHCDAAQFGFPCFLHSRAYVCRCRIKLRCALPSQPSELVDPPCAIDQHVKILSLNCLAVGNAFGLTCIIKRTGGKEFCSVEHGGAW